MIKTCVIKIDMSKKEVILSLDEFKRLEKQAELGKAVELASEQEFNWCKHINDFGLFYATKNDILDLLEWYRRDIW